ncbi:hypothetical protein B296_00044088 [Ensete ventricosum]|uniref:Xylanase inhibitor N-terminal domain-containing protein n=1 Tax=Ensete ventricosum TaxID=4639 RepID=A0A426XBI5_ENSVE|nr:hypothetical protein B296_00044088 [Ensete ventricosum]
MAFSASAFFLYTLSNDSFYDRLPMTTILLRRLPHSSAKTSFYTRLSSSCTITVASAPTSSDTFPTLSVADDGFYTCSPMPAIAHRLLMLCREGTISSFLLSNDGKSPANCRLHVVAASSSSPLQRPLPLAIVISYNFCCFLQPTLPATPLPFPTIAATFCYSLSCPKRRRCCLLYPLSCSSPSAAPVIHFLLKSSSSTRLIGCHNPHCLWIHPWDRLSRCPSCNSTFADGCPTVPCPPYALIYDTDSTVDLLMQETLAFPHRTIPNFMVGCSILSKCQPASVVGFGRGAPSLPSKMGLKCFSSLFCRGLLFLDYRSTTTSSTDEERHHCHRCPLLPSLSSL